MSSKTHITQIKKKEESQLNGTGIRLACGVRKFDINTTGYEEIKIIVDKLLERKHGDGFISIIIRHVSEENLGIHYTYIKNFNSEEESSEILDFMSYKHMKEMCSSLGYILYAGDNMHREISQDQIKDYILVNKPLNYMR